MRKSTYGCRLCQRLIMRNINLGDDILAHIHSSGAIRLSYQLNSDEPVIIYLTDQQLDKLYDFVKEQNLEK